MIKFRGISRLFQYDTRVLFLCRENICRSPLAEGLLRHHLRQAGVAGRHKVSSAGTRVSQTGARPDRRAQKVAATAGINLGRTRASRVTEKDLVQSDFILAMDHSNIRDIDKICPAEHRHKVSLLLTYLPDQEVDEVPDPYYGSYESFEKVFRLIEDAVVSLIPHIVTVR